MNKQFDLKKIERAVSDILTALGEDPEREGLKETPKRVAKMYNEVFRGMLYTNDEIAEMFNKCFEETSQDLVCVKNIKTFSYCEHHIALMYDLNISVAYIPNGKVIGISKIARIAEMVCKRLQLQERIGSDIAEIVQKIVQTEDVAVFITGCHSCMTARGVKSIDSKTSTSTLKGKFKTDPALRSEVLELINY